MIDRQLRVVSYNIHRGLSPFRKREVLDNIAAVLLSTKADILFLQEDIYSEVFTASEVFHRCREVWKNGIYGETIIAPRGSQGNTILSHYPIIKTDNFDISSKCGEARRVLSAEVEWGGTKPLKVFCTHLGLTRKQRLQQSRKLLRCLKTMSAKDDPMILAGDFNDWKEELSGLYKRHLNLEEAYQFLHGKHAKSFPAAFPMLSLDRIYFRALKPKIATVVRNFGWRGRSDHLPIMVEFAF